MPSVCFSRAKSEPSSLSIKPKRAFRRQLPLVSFQLGQQHLLEIIRYGEPPNYFRPELNGRRGKQVLRQRYDVEIVVEVRSKPAMLCTARGTGMAFAIRADTTKVLPGGISEEDVGPKIDGLS